ncbi:MAG: class I SAM-dependent methyltransferase [Enterobacteriaceae bacterium]
MSELTQYARNQFTYLKHFIAAPRTMGTLTPSSSWLCNAMLSQVEWQNTYSIAELGAATGVLTRRILSHMRSDAILQVYEIENLFLRELQKIEDPRLQVMAQSAERLDQDHDIIFSSLPLLSIPTRVSIRILQKVQQSLHQRNGTLMLFQYSWLSEQLLSRYFTWEKTWVIKNLPPAIVYTCKPRRDYRA